jgi:vacuolar-type H+-ATPase subunit E/Vma4
MALPDLIAALEADVEAQAGKILADAEAEAARIATESRERLRSTREADLGATQRSARASAAGRIAEAEHSARAERIVARTAMLDAIFEEAAARFPAVLDDARYRQSLPAQLRDAISFAATDAQLEIRCSDGIRDVVAGALRAGVRTRISTEPLRSSGFEVLASDGWLQVDGTLEGRLAVLRPQLSIEVLRTFDDVG